MRCLMSSVFFCGSLMDPQHFWMLAILFRPFHFIVAPSHASETALIFVSFLGINLKGYFLEATVLLIKLKYETSSLGITLFTTLRGTHPLGSVKVGYPAVLPLFYLLIQPTRGRNTLLLQSKSRSFQECQAPLETHLLTTLSM